MISSITMQNVASFADAQPVTIKTTEKVNLFYGINGTGKSTIGRYLQNSSDPQYLNCRMALDPPGVNDFEIMVYNEDFVEANFYGKEKQQGVFTLGKDNAAAQKAINDAEITIAKNTIERENLEGEKNTLIRQLGATKSAVQDKLFKIKQDNDKQTLDYCLTGAKTKDGFFDAVNKTPLEDVIYSFKDIENEVNEINKQNGIPKPLLGIITLNISSIEVDPIWGEVIIGTGDSYLSELITKLANNDWVNEGLGFIQKSEGKCPFCQKTLPDNFREEIAKVFDQSYEEKKHRVIYLVNQYKLAIETFKSELNNLKFKDEYVTRNKDYSNAKENLISLLEKNLCNIENKIRTPSERVELTTVNEPLKKLQTIVQIIDTEIKTFNNKIANKPKSLNDIKSKFWKLVRKQFNPDILTFDASSKIIGDNLNKLLKHEKEIVESDKLSHQIISDNRKLITNIDGAIESINRQITLLGLEGFTIQKESTNSNAYRIKRNERSEVVYKTLSEGEKTLITFLYFLELCEGSVKQDAPLNLSKRIIVIDDPISSLSHNYVYDIANMIHHRVISPAKYRQIFILTHSLFFFHEFLRIKNPKGDKPKNYLLFRVSKCTKTDVSEISSSEVLNDYQSFWQIIKDAQVGKINRVIVPNVMRNILEYYFSFIHKKDILKSALEELETERATFRSFYRFINRESHSDSVNITDFGELDPLRFVEHFRAVFERTKFLEHYNIMMGIENVKV